MLLEHVITLKSDYQHGKEADADEITKHILTSFDNCWGKLDEYYKAIDETPVYVATIVLHPGLRWKFLKERWTIMDQKRWLKTAEIKRGSTEESIK